MEMNDKLPDLKFSKDVIKGRIAETLIEQLFLSMDYEVYRFGMENTVPGLAHGLSDYGEVATFIRRMPDFIIKDKNGKVSFIEVKYRANKEFILDESKGKYPFNDVYFIILSKNTIKCITLNELRNGKTITSTTGDLLGNRSEFKLNRSIIVKFCKFAEKLFENV
jgi:hypothetical protein